MKSKPNAVLAKNGHGDAKNQTALSK